MNRRFLYLFLSFLLFLLFNLNAQEVTATSNLEQEPNDEKLTANNLQLGNTYTGYTHYVGGSGFWGGAVGEFDYYKFTLEKAGQVTLSVGNHEKYTWSFSLSDTDGKEFIDVDTENGVKVNDQKITHTNRSVGLEAGTYYFKIYGNHPKNEMAEIPYNFTVNFIEGNNFESEPNDELLSAKNIKINNTYVGHSYYVGGSGFWGGAVGEFDYYKFTIEKPQEITISMKNNEKYAWSFILKDSNNQELLNADTETGVKVVDKKLTHTSKTVGLSAGTYYILLHGNHEKREMEHIPYELTVKKNGPTKVMWGKTELKLGQIGKATILSNTALVKIESNGTLSTVRAIKKGEEYRVYSFKNNHGGLYGVGGGYFIKKSSEVKYETPSKSKMDLLK